MGALRARLLALLVLMLGCTPGAEQPIDPVWGKQACDHCLMLISEKRPAAQATLADGSRKFFDDVGCLVVWQKREHESPRHVWVRAPKEERWIDARSAHYRGGQRTPMDYGFLAAPDGITFEELTREVEARGSAREPSTEARGSAREPNTEAREQNEARREPGAGAM